MKRRRQSLAVWLFTPGRRWWQLADLALGIALAIDRHRARPPEWRPEDQ